MNWFEKECEIMKKLLNTLYVTNELCYLSKDGENVVVKIDGKEVLRRPIHIFEGIICFNYNGVSPGIIKLCANNNIQLALLPSLLTDLFPTAARYTAIGLSFNMCDGLLGGIAPFLALYVVNKTHNPASFVLFFIAATILSLIALPFVEEKEVIEDWVNGIIIKIDCNLFLKRKYES